MRRAVVAAAASAALLLSPPVCSAASSSHGPPSREELRQKSMKDLKGILKRKGAKCKKCVEKDDVIDRVIDTWDWAPNEASSPDGKMRMTKDVFISNLKSSYKRHLKSNKKEQEGHQLDGDDDGEAHSEGSGPSDEELEKVWKEFSEKLSLGQVEKDENGHLVYEVPTLGGGQGSFWERWKIHIMLMANVTLLWFMQRQRRKANRLDSRKAEPGQGTEEVKDKSEAETKDKAE
mmetsp:Transcript_65306/g.202245  ORF Transcript_65306/g.202245 Transcript_65306/m.202245 type:complete len:233 (+) Transcript_65306:105-803(+)